MPFCRDQVCQHAAGGDGSRVGGKKDRAQFVNIAHSAHIGLHHLDHRFILPGECHVEEIEKGLVNFGFTLPPIAPVDCQISWKSTATTATTPASFLMLVVCSCLLDRMLEIPQENQ